MRVAVVGVSGRVWPQVAAESQETQEKEPAQRDPSPRTVARRPGQNEAGRAAALANVEALKNGENDTRCLTTYRGALFHVRE